MMIEGKRQARVKDDVETLREMSADRTESPAGRAELVLYPEAVEEVPAADDPDAVGITAGHQGHARRAAGLPGRAGERQARPRLRQRARRDRRGPGGGYPQVV